MPIINSGQMAFTRQRGCRDAQVAHHPLFVAIRIYDHCLFKLEPALKRVFKFREKAGSVATLIRTIVGFQRASAFAIFSTDEC